MKPFRLLSIGLIFAAPLIAFGIQAEAGASYVMFRDARFEPDTVSFATDEPDRAAPYLAATHAFSPRLGLRVSYHFIDNARATTLLGSLPGSVLPVVVKGHYRDDIHLLTAGPEFNWSVSTRATVAIVPQLNWVSSRGTVRYSSTDSLVLLVPPRKRSDDGFTLGATARLQWSLGPRTAAVASYQYVDLDPSFERKAHVLSGGISWRF